MTHRATKGDYTTTLSRVQVEITDDDDGEDQIGSRPSGAVWWAALTARRETGGATGHIDYTSPHADTGKLSNDSFTYGGVTRAIDGLFVDRNGHFQIWVDSGNGSVLPNGSVLHVGSESLTLGSATRQSFRTMYNDGRAPTMAAALPVVSVGAAASPVTEGAAAVFTLSRTGDAAPALTVTVSVSEDGAVLSGTPASAVTFGAGSDEATLSVATDDDSVAEADGRVTASVVAGSGYGVEANASAAAVDVYDNDEAATTPTTAVETLWTSTLTVESIGGVLLGTVGGGNALSPDGWSEDGEPFEVEQLYYFPQYSELAFTLSVAPSETGQLTLHLDDLQVQLRGSPGVRYFYWVVDHLAGRRAGRGGEADAHGPGRGSGGGSRPLGGGCAGTGGGRGGAFLPCDAGCGPSLDRLGALCDRGRHGGGGRGL